MRSDDIRRLEAGQQVVVGTPGRVYDMINRRALRTDAMRIFVLDEADEMLSRGYALMSLLRQANLYSSLVDVPGHPCAMLATVLDQLVFRRLFSQIKSSLMPSKDVCVCCGRCCYLRVGLELNSPVFRAAGSFKDQIYDVFKFLPSKVQVGLFSATMPTEVLEITKHFMRDPVR